MIKLEIVVRPKRIKYLEFSQSLETLKTDLLKRCASLQITEESKSFSIIAELNSIEELISILYSKELGLLSGAIRMLAEESEVIIHGIGHKRKGSDLREIRLNYLKRKKKSTIN